MQRDLVAGELVIDERWEKLAEVFDAAAQECRALIGQTVNDDAGADVIRASERLSGGSWTRLVTVEAAAVSCTT